MILEPINVPVGISGTPYPRIWRLRIEAMDGDDVNVCFGLVIFRVDLGKTDTLSWRLLVPVGLCLISRCAVSQLRVSMTYHWRILEGLIEYLEDGWLYSMIYVV